MTKYLDFADGGFVAMQWHVKYHEAILRRMKKKLLSHMPAQIVAHTGLTAILPDCLTSVDFVQPVLTVRLGFFTWCLTVSHAAINLMECNFDFPTRVEALLWRVASLALLVDLFAWGGSRF